MAEAVPGERYTKTLKESIEFMVGMYKASLSVVGREGVRRAYELWLGRPYDAGKVSELMSQDFMRGYSPPTPVMLWGTPGIGKSRAVEQAAEGPAHQLDDPQHRLQAASSPQKALEAMGLGHRLAAPHPHVELHGGRKAEAVLHPREPEPVHGEPVLGRDPQELAQLLEGQP